MPAQVKFTMKKSSAVTIPMSGSNGIKKSVCFMGYSHVGDLKLATILECLPQNQDLVVTKIAKSVTNILKLSPTHFVSIIRHQHRCSCFTTFFNKKKSQDLAKYKWNSEHCSNTKTNYGNG